MSATFLCGNSRDVLRDLPDNFVHCVVTSPPYFGLRKYDGGEDIWADGWVGQLGAESTPELFIQHLIEVMREVRRVLRPDGVFWLNIGDSWAGSWGNYGKRNGRQREVRTARHDRPAYKDYTSRPASSYKVDGVKPLDMMLVPEQLALAARADGWFVRSVLIWAKGVSLTTEYNGNPMPESVNGWRWEQCRVKVDGEFQPCLGCEKCASNGGFVLRKGSWRPTDSYEQVLMLTKTKSYFCDREAVLEASVYPAGESRKGGNGHKSLDAGSRTTEGLHNKDWNGNGGRNLRSVLVVPTAGFKGAHFAVFPPKLIEPLIKSATSEAGCCPSCGAPWVRVIGSKEVSFQGGSGRAGRSAENINAIGKWAGKQYGKNIKLGPVVSSRTVGWLPTCGCDYRDPIPCRVLDPFSGAGTTALVCDRLGLESFNIDTSAKYIELAEQRLSDDALKRCTTTTTSRPT